MFDLPRDILINILSRLPAKSLGQFKSVSKYWLSLISSKEFIKFHHRRALFDTNTNHSRVFVISTHSLHSINYESPSCYEGVDDDYSRAIISLTDPFEKESVIEKKLGSCYGLIFSVCFDDCILLWNPTTGKTRVIPDPLTPSSNGTRFYGLGYDFSIDDYKMVSVSRTISSNSISCQVFNLKIGSWRTVQTAHMSINDHDMIGSFTNDAIHWIVRHRPHDDGFNKREAIISFNIKDEVFMDIVLPNGGENEQSGFRCLGDLKGCLYAVYGGGGDDGVDMEVWVMKEYGIESSWSKVIKLEWIRFGCDYGIMTPVCFTHEDDVVIDLDSWDLVRFNVKDNTIKRFKKCSNDWNLWVVYTETLVSPYG
ncbi:F-box/kelch-repeat protein At3g06240-like [Bidens hawaiensis]|uniref:F-box/kelch-repeat protein At3g06240-like n=1 Tax=Bidens hawaiensis TaxID=980011 RepID=UPI004049EE4E